ncbi:MAG: hypothetical protein LBO68_02405 [Synergistaceae bacterium]|jgi:hypothetical protein|nr:hypothetical protein [Synergistaceae bacterium]
MFAALLDLLLSRLGRLFPWIMKGKTKGSYLYLMFPFYHDNEEAREHLQIARAVAEYKPIILFTGPSKDEALKPEFEKCGQVLRMIKDRGFGARRMKAFRLGALLSALNGNDEAVVFGAGSMDFYNFILRKCRAGLRSWDMLLDSYSMLNMRRVSKLEGRIVFDDETYENIEFIYKLNDVEEEYLPRVHWVKQKEDLAPLLREKLAKK